MCFDKTQLENLLLSTIQQEVQVDMTPVQFAIPAHLALELPAPTPPTPPLPTTIPNWALFPDPEIDLPADMRLTPSSPFRDTVSEASLPLGTFNDVSEDAAPWRAPVQLPLETTGMSLPTSEYFLQ